MNSRIYENALTTVEWPHEDYIPAILCPITGMVVSLGFGPEQDPNQANPRSPEDEKCPTLLFRYNYETGMEFIRSELADAILEKKRQLVEAGEAEDEEDLDDLEIISEHLEDLGQAPMVIDMPTYALSGDGVTIGLDLARDFPGN